jgi:hypothetical protein
MIQKYHGSVNQYNEDVQKFKSFVEQQQTNAEQAQVDGKLFNTIIQLQSSVNDYHVTLNNPKNYYPTFFVYGNSNGTVTNKNQPTPSYAAEIDLNAIDDKQHSFGQNSSINNASWAAYIPNDGEYFGVTSNGIVFATSTPPDTQPDDATQGLNNGNSGDGGWTNNNIQVYVTCGMPNVPKTETLSLLESMTTQQYIDSQHA